MTAVTKSSDVKTTSPDLAPSARDASLSLIIVSALSDVQSSSSRHAKNVAMGITSSVLRLAGITVAPDWDLMKAAILNDLGEQGIAALAKCLMTVPLQSIPEYGHTVPRQATAVRSTRNVQS